MPWTNQMALSLCHKTVELWNIAEVQWPAQALQELLSATRQGHVL